MTQAPPDRVLTEAGHEPDVVRPGRVLLIACGALAREILALIDMNGWDHMDLACLPAKFHNTPQHIIPALRDRISRARADGYGQIFVVYADCGTGGELDRLCAEEGVQRIEGPHCYSFFEGNAAFADHPEEITAFYLTDFLTRQFDTLIWKGMGLDRHPDLRDMMFGHYEKVVYLSQVDDADLVSKARAAADRLGLAFEHRPSGYGDLTGFLARAAENAAKSQSFAD